MIDAPLQTRILINGNKFSSILKSAFQYFKSNKEIDSSALFFAFRKDLFNLLHYFNKAEYNHYECYCIGFYVEIADNIYLDLHKSNISKELSAFRSIPYETQTEVSKKILAEGVFPLKNLSAFYIFGLNISQIEKNKIFSFINEIFSFATYSLISADGNINSTEEALTENYLNLLCKSFNGNVDDIQLIKEDSFRNVEYFDTIEKLEHVLKFNSVELQSINPDSIRDGFKIISFLKKKFDLIQQTITIYNNCENSAQLPAIIDLINEQIRNYNYIFYYALLYFDVIKNNHLFEFYSIREYFESCGVFQTKFEENMQANVEGIRHDINSVGKDLLKGLEAIKNELVKINDGITQINYNLREAVDAISSLEKNTFLGLKNLGDRISSDINLLNTSVSKNLKSINSGIALNNLFSAVQIYQNHKIQKYLQ